MKFNELSDSNKQKMLSNAEKCQWLKLARHGSKIWNGFMRHHMGKNSWFDMINKLDDDFPLEKKRELEKVDELSKQEIQSLLYPNEEYPIDFPKRSIKINHVLIEESLDFDGFVLDNIHFFGCYLTNASFKNCIFNGQTSYYLSRINNANFDKSIFLGSLKLYNLDVYGSISFYEIICEDRFVCDYDQGTHVIFNKHVNFKNAVFKKLVSLNEVIFQEESNFEGVVFKEDCVFKKVFFSDATFDNAIFEKKSDFQGSRFDKASFVGANFNHIANFLNACFHSPPHFHGIAFSDVLFTKNKAFFKNDINTDKDVAASAWSSLINLMEKTHNQHQRQIFHERLLELEKSYEGQKLARPLYEVYEVFGNGKYEILPFLWLCSFCLWFAGIYASYLGKTVETAFLYSLANSFPFLKQSREAYEKLGTISNELIIVGGLQSIISIFLLFLIGLALRNRFRIK